MSDVSRILSDVQAGRNAATEQLLPLVYEELRKLAHARLANEKPGQTLQATALVHEAYLRLLGGDSDKIWDSSGHFFAAAAEAMRRILVDRARRMNAAKHGGGKRPISLDNVDVLARDSSADLLALDSALAELDEAMPEVGQIVKLRYFAGLSVEQTSHAMDVSTRTVHRHWAYAKAWLFQRLSRDL